MKIWREAHHAARLTYEEWKQHASWYEKAKDWLRHAFPRWWERRLGHWGLDKNAKSLELEMGALPNNLGRADLQRPTPAKRNRYAIVAIPKKTGVRIEPDLGRDDKEEVWGLLFEEGFAVHRLLFYVLILYFLASLIAVVLLYLQKSPSTSPTTLATPQPLANKTWIFIWVGTFVTLFLGVWFKWAETPKRTG